MADALQVKGLKKSYGNIPVLKGIDFSVQQGEIFALLGVNGAGKTTALECIEGLRAYDNGEITIHGKAGIQLQSATLQAFIKPLEAVNLFSKWNKTKPDTEMLKALGIYEISKNKYTELSTGQKRRLHLALALIGNPDIVFLDEPTAGLDVEARHSLHEQIKELKKQGKTIILASHDMAEVETLCDRIAILKDGKIAFIGTIEELIAAVGKQYTVHITTPSGRQSYVTDNLTQTLLEKISEYKDKKIEISDIRTDRGTLEQHFIDINESIFIRRGTSIQNGHSQQDHAYYLLPCPARFLFLYERHIYFGRSLRGKNADPVYVGVCYYHERAHRAAAFSR